MIGVEHPRRFGHRRRWYQRLEFIGSCGVGWPCRRAAEIRIAGRGESSPIADHRVGERLLFRRERVEASESLVDIEKILISAP